MKIKRYFAADMRQAIRMVRDEQGPDAVILSNRKVQGGVEIVAAVDYDAELVTKMSQPEPQARAPFQSRPEPQPEPVAQSAWQRAMDDTQPEPAPEPAPKPAKAEIVWSQDPSLVAMREEIKTLRSILEGQLSGLAWGEQRRSHPMRAKLLERLMRLGLGAELGRSLADRVSYSDSLDHSWRQAMGLLVQQLPVTNDDILNHGGIVAVVGPTGVGKTTTVAKLAARYALRHGRNRVALVTTDSYRIGAHQQLKTFGSLIGVPVHLANDGAELKKVLSGLRDKSLVLIDTAGMSQRDLRLSEQFTMLQESGFPIRTYAVLSTTTQRAALDEVVRAFAHVDLDGCILTKVDESTGVGEALSVVVGHQLPVAYVSDGQRVPEDLQPARANNLIMRAASLMQQHAEKPAEEELAMAFGRVGNGHG